MVGPLIRYLCSVVGWGRLIITHRVAFEVKTMTSVKIAFRMRLNRYRRPYFIVSAAISAVRKFYIGALVTKIAYLNIKIT